MSCSKHSLEFFGAFLERKNTSTKSKNHVLAPQKTAAVDRVWGPPLLDSDANEAALLLPLACFLVVDNLKLKLGHKVVHAAAGCNR